MANIARWGFACICDLGGVYLPEKPGFYVTHNEWLADVNAYAQAEDITASPRYMIVVSKR
ncbi:MAG: hypothetical protein AAF708_11070 [Deinococcota bacterium]